MTELWYHCLVDIISKHVPRKSKHKSSLAQSKISWKITWKEINRRSEIIWRSSLYQHKLLKTAKLPQKSENLSLYLVKFSIGNLLLKKLSCSISKFLYLLFIAIANKCTFPSTCKVSEIVTIFKTRQTSFQLPPNKSNVTYSKTLKSKVLEKLLFDKMITSWSQLKQIMWLVSTQISRKRSTGLTIGLLLKSLEVLVLQAHAWNYNKITCIIESKPFESDEQSLMFCPYTAVYLSCRFSDLRCSSFV